MLQYNDETDWELNALHFMHKFNGMLVKAADALEKYKQEITRGNRHQLTRFEKMFPRDIFEGAQFPEAHIRELVFKISDTTLDLTRATLKFKQVARDCLNEPKGRVRRITHGNQRIVIFIANQIKELSQWVEDMDSSFEERTHDRAMRIQELLNKPSPSTITNTLLGTFMGMDRFSQKRAGEILAREVFDLTAGDTDGSVSNSEWKQHVERKLDQRVSDACDEIEETCIKHARDSFIDNDSLRELITTHLTGFSDTLYPKVLSKTHKAYGDLLESRN